MTPWWIALTSERPAGASAVATVSSSSAHRSLGGGGADTDGGAVIDGHLAAWEAKRPPVPGAVKIDPRAIDPDGGPAWASLVLAPPGAWLLFDDVAVSHALRAVLAAPPLDVVSTLVLGDDRFVGALTAVHDKGPSRLADDPFAAIFATTVVRVGGGLLGTTPWPVGPVIQRYGGANPWPWDRFAT